MCPKHYIYIHKHTCIHIYLNTLGIFYRRFLFNGVYVSVYGFVHMSVVTCGGQKKGPLKLEVQVIVSHLMGAESQNLVL